MQNGTNYNVAIGQFKIYSKSKGSKALEIQVVLGGSVTDNSLSMADQLKNIEIF
jgi:hypothetical protein